MAADFAASWGFSGVSAVVPVSVGEVSLDVWFVQAAETRTAAATVIQQRPRRFEAVFDRRTWPSLTRALTSASTTAASVPERVGAVNYHPNGCLQEALWNERV